MSTQITDPEQQDLTQRDGFIAALAASEHFISTFPVLPNSIDVRCYPWHPVPEISPYFHHQPDAVREFAECFGGSVSECAQDDRVLTEARGEVNGVAFRAWSLTAAQSEGAEVSA